MLAGHTAIATWIWLKNVPAFIDVIARLVRYDIDETDREAIRLGLESSDSDAAPPRWYVFELHGRDLAKLKIGQDQGTNVVNIRLQLPDELAGRATTALELMSEY